MALCEGPIAGINQVWKNQSVYSLEQLGLSLFPGTTPQSVWSYLATAYPSQALAYQGTAYLARPNYSLGDTATLDNHNFEVQGIRYGSGYGQPGNTIRPTRVGTGAELRVRRRRSGLGGRPIFSPTPNTASAFRKRSIDATTLFGAGGDASYQTYCQAVGLALRPALTDQEQAPASWGAGCS